MSQCNFMLRGSLCWLAEGILSTSAHWLTVRQKNNAISSKKWTTETSIWANQNMSLTWIKAIKGDDSPYSSSSMGFGRWLRWLWNLPRSMRDPLSPLCHNCAVNFHRQIPARTETDLLQVHLGAGVGLIGLAGLSSNMAGAGKSPMNWSFMIGKSLINGPFSIFYWRFYARKTMRKWSIFQQAMFDDTGG